MGGRSRTAGCGGFPHEWGTTNFPGAAGEEWLIRKVGGEEGGRKSGARAFLASCFPDWVPPCRKGGNSGNGQPFHGTGNGSEARWHGAMARWDGAVARRDGAVARWDGAMARWDGAVARWDGATARWDGATARWDGEFPQEWGATCMAERPGMGMGKAGFPELSREML